MPDITDAVNLIATGGTPPDPAVARIYAELRATAARQLSRSGGSSLHVTELTHEAFLKLFRPGQKPWESRAHFFGSAARAMQQVLIDRWNAAGRRPTPIGDAIDNHIAPGLPPQGDPRPVIAAIEQLAELDPDMAEIVRLRCFAGLSVEQVAELTGTSGRTVKRHFATASAWLYARVYREP